MGQRTVYLPLADLMTIDKLASEAPPAFDKATFWRYSVILGAHVLDQALKEIKPEALAPVALRALLKTKAGRRMIKVEAITEEELPEEELPE